MVVKLFFTDGSETVQSFSDKDLEDHNLLNKINDYFKEHLWPQYPIDSYEIFDRKKCPVDWDDYCLRNFDYRDYFNYSKSFIGAVIDSRVVERVEFFENNTYEYGLDSLEGEPYERCVKFNYTLDHYYYSKLSYDPENWDK